MKKLISIITGVLFLLLMTLIIVIFIALAIAPLFLIVAAIVTGNLTYLWFAFGAWFLFVLVKLLLAFAKQEGWLDS